VSSTAAVSVAGLTLKNPVIAGSGEATMNLGGILAALDAGAAAVVAKSTNESEAAKRQLGAAEYVLLDERWRPLPWGPAPAGSTLFCRSGLVAEPFERWLEILVRADREARGRDAFVAASIVVSGADDAIRMAKEIEAAGLRWLELNVGAPHAEEAAPGAIRAATEAGRIDELVGPIRAAVTIPLTVKLGMLGDPAAAAEAAFAAGADAACLAGRHLGFLPDPETRRPILGTFGAVGGGWALPLTLRWIARTRQRLGPARSLIGTNGARDGLDVVRFLLAGASAVEMTSAVMTDGPGALTRVIEELEVYLSQHGVRAADIVGEATDHVMTYEGAGAHREVRG